jgi:hypothetical protein
VAGRLRDDGFEVREHVPSTFSREPFRLVARRRRVEATKLGQAETVFVLSLLPSIDRSAMRAFSHAAFEFATKEAVGGMPRGMGRAVFCYPVAIVPSVDDATSEAVRREPPAKHFSANEIPVIVDLGTGTLHFFEKTPLWGAAYYRGFRKTIATLLPP